MSQRLHDFQLSAMMGHRLESEIHRIVAFSQAKDIKLILAEPRSAFGSVLADLGNSRVPRNPS
jgi:hypothetical protein